MPRAWWYAMTRDGIRRANVTTVCHLLESLLHLNGRLKQPSCWLIALPVSIYQYDSFGLQFKPLPLEALNMFNTSYRCFARFPLPLTMESFSVHSSYSSVGARTLNAYRDFRSTLLWYLSQILGRFWDKIFYEILFCLHGGC